MKIYLAARYSRRHELRGYAQQLRRAGHQVTSRWIYTEHADARKNDAEIALRDYEDLVAANCLVAFTESPGCGGRNRGGRHVEFGAALALKMVLIVVGPLENVFHSLPQVAWFDAFDDLVPVLAHVQEATTP